MKKKVFAILLSFAMVVTMMPAMAFATGATDETPLPEDAQVTNEFQKQPIDEKRSGSVGLKFLNHKIGSHNNLKGEVTELSGEYTVSENVSIDHRLTVTNAATIKLNQGCELKIKGGINVKNDRSLTIQGPGTLSIYDVADNLAGIGGNNLEKCGNVTISGGTTVTVTGGYQGAGIGGGNKGDGGTVKISQSNVTANGGRDGAGIGGGDEGKGGNTTIYSGSVKAYGNIANGIGGGGYDGDCGDTTIYGGNVLAQGSKFGAGIGGCNTNGGTIIIKGGIVTAKGGVDGPGIGGTDDKIIGKITITISGGVVSAIGGENYAGIGNSREGDSITITGGNVTASGSPGIGGKDNAGTINISGGVVTATGIQRASGIGGAINNKGGTINISGGVVTAISRFRGAGIGGGLNGYGCDVTISGGVVIAESKDAACIGRGTHGRELGTLNLGDNLSAFDISDGRHERLILNPTKEELDGIRKVFIQSKNDAIAIEPTVRRMPWDYNGKMHNAIINNGSNVILIGTTSAKDAGIYHISVAPEYGYVWNDGTRDTVYYQWRILPKHVNQVRAHEQQNISKNDGKFKAPEILDHEIREEITGKLTYTYENKEMTKEAIEAKLAQLPEGEHGTIYWKLDANGNYSGTVKGGINFTIQGSQDEFNVEVETWNTSFFGITTYHAKITANPEDKVKQISHSTTGLIYLPGDKVTSFREITHFYIRITAENGKRYYYEYRNGQVWSTAKSVRTK